MILLFVTTQPSTFFEIGSEARIAGPSLIEALQDTQFEVRGYSATALGKFGAELGVVEVLTQQINDEDEDVRILIVRALGNIGPKAISSMPRLRAVLAERDLRDDSRRTVEESLSKISMNQQRR